MDIVITIFEWIGLISFALSGAMLAIQKEMDILGVCVLGAVTATGGGIMRDLILGITPPANLANPFPVLLAVGVSIIIFLPFFQKFLSGKPHVIYEKFMFCISYFSIYTTEIRKIPNCGCLSWKKAGLTSGTMPR